MIFDMFESAPMAVNVEVRPFRPEHSGAGDVVISFGTRAALNLNVKWDEVRQLVAALEAALVEHQAALDAVDPR